MNLHQSQDRINELMSLFVTQVKGSTAMGRTDINLISETVLIPLLAEVYGYKNLNNLNYTSGDNYPGIDLADDKAKVAFQITSTSSSKKVKDTLQKIVKYELYKKYDRFIIYILSEKQQSYSGKGYNQIIQGQFDFDKDRDILDYRDILKEVANLQIDQTRRVSDVLEANFGPGRAPLLRKIDEPQVETAFLNLLELSFPQTIYVADPTLSRKEIIRNSKSDKVKLKKNSSTRNVVRAALKQQGLSFGVDWVCHEGKIVTFHNLSDEYLPLSKIVDSGTITPLRTEEFYETDENYERVFKRLLRRCMQQKSYSFYM